MLTPEQRKELLATYIERVVAIARSSDPKPEDRAAARELSVQLNDPNRYVGKDIEGVQSLLGRIAQVTEESREGLSEKAADAAAQAAEIREQIAQLEAEAVRLEAAAEDARVCGSARSNHLDGIARVLTVTPWYKPALKPDLEPIAEELEERGVHL